MFGIWISTTEKQILKIVTRTISPLSTGGDILVPTLPNPFQPPISSKTSRVSNFHILLSLRSSAIIAYYTPSDLRPIRIINFKYPTALLAQENYPFKPSEKLIIPNIACPDYALLILLSNI